MLYFRLFRIYLVCILSYCFILFYINLFCFFLIFFNYFVLFRRILVYIFSFCFICFTMFNFDLLWFYWIFCIILFSFNLRSSFQYTDSRFKNLIGHLIQRASFCECIFFNWKVCHQIKILWSGVDEMCWRMHDGGCWDARWSKSIRRFLVFTLILLSWKEKLSFLLLRPKIRGFSFCRLSLPKRSERGRIRAGASWLSSEVIPLKWLSWLFVQRAELVLPLARLSNEFFYCDYLPEDTPAKVFFS